MELDKLSVRLLHLVDDEGNVRISLNGGSKTTVASIVMYRGRHPALQILDNSAEDEIQLSFLGRSGRVTALTPKGLSVDDANGLPAIVIGCGLDGSTYQLTVFDDGKPVFQLPLSGSDDVDEES